MGKAILLLLFVAECYALLDYGRGPAHLLGRFYQGEANREEDVTMGPFGKKTKKPKRDYVLEELVNEMRAADVDAPGKNDYKVDYGNKVSGTYDQSDNDLFYDVNEALFERPVYAVLVDLVKNGVFQHDVCEQEEPMTGNRRAQVQKLLDTWTDTEVFKLAFEYLQKKGEKHSNSFEELKEFLFDYWFGTYSRCSGKAEGSSGFEHVFTGEWKKGTVGGHHNWVTYYLAQKAGEINYYGYHSERGALTGTFQYDWRGFFKKMGGMLFATSPAFDFALFTVCSLTHSGTNGCQYYIDGVKLGVTSFTQTCPSGLCLATAYPTN